MDSTEITLRAAVREAICEAMLQGVWIRIYLRGDPARSIAIREYSGVPVCFIPGKDGSERVVLTVAEGQTEQIIRVDRIARVVFQTPEAASR